MRKRPNCTRTCGPLPSAPWSARLQVWLWASPAGHFSFPRTWHTSFHPAPPATQSESSLRLTALRSHRRDRAQATPELPEQGQRRVPPESRSAEPLSAGQRQARRTPPSGAGRIAGSAAGHVTAPVPPQAPPSSHPRGPRCPCSGSRRSSRPARPPSAPEPPAREPGSAPPAPGGRAASPSSCEATAAAPPRSPRAAWADAASTRRGRCPCCCW